MTQEELDDSLRKQRIARLLACPIFATLSSIELASLSRSFTEVSYPPGETFIIQGEDDPTLFVIAYGLVEVFRVDNAAATYIWPILYCARPNPFFADFPYQFSALR